MIDRTGRLEQVGLRGLIERGPTSRAADQLRSSFEFQVDGAQDRLLDRGAYCHGAVSPQKNTILPQEGPDECYRRLEGRPQLFLFPVDKDPKTGRAPEFSGWRYVSQEGWIGVVQERDGVCFMAAMRGREKDIASYLPKKPE